MPLTGPYNEVIDRADLGIAGHPFHISFMADFNAGAGWPGVERSVESRFRKIERSSW